jgi:hypothetical protein
MMVSNLGAAIEYTVRGWRIFPCRQDKKPHVDHWDKVATIDPCQILVWWRRRPSALIGCPTDVNGFDVLDIDVKNGNDGFKTLAELGYAVLPKTRSARTQSGGTHLHFRAVGIHGTTGAKGRGIGPGLDWRGVGNYVILPSPIGGYEWTSEGPLDDIPTDLLPREPPREIISAPVGELSDCYLKAALQNACQNILCARAGHQEHTLNGECFSIGRLFGHTRNADHALSALLHAAHQIPSYDPKRPWRSNQIDHKVRRAFADGLRNPRVSG